MRIFATAVLFGLISSFLAAGTALEAAPPAATINSPMPPPGWALLERELLRANADACREFFGRYFDERGFLLCVERWGGNDGPDDAIENCHRWPILHALGAHDDVLTMYKKAWEGHLRQYTLAKTVDVPFARDGMYYKEFPVTFDWLHNSEGLTVFNLQGLSDPDNGQFRKRVLRYAGFYMNEDPQAQNYDPKHKIIRSMFNGSRGPLLRKATGLDWAGDPIEVKDRFDARHGEDNYEQMIAHFKDYNDIVGDHPQNLLATALPLNAYMITHHKKYKNWILEYVDAWRKRIIENDYIVPTNIGLDGTIGGAADGKWYGGVYGWGFTVTVPQDGSLAHRNTHYLGLNGFTNAYLLTGDDIFLDPWRKQIDKINAQKKVIDGKTMYPRMYGDDGWYSYSTQPYTHGAKEIYYMTMKPEDRRLANSGWFAFLERKNDRFPEAALRGDLSRIRQKIQAMRKDTTTPDTRLADDPMRFNPASIQSLVELMCGGLQTTKNGLVQHCRLRYFDVDKRRAGVPDDVATLIDTMTDHETRVILVNTNQLESRTVVIQAGGYGEHQFVAAKIGDSTVPVDKSQFTVKLAAGCGSRITFKMRRYVNQPTLAFPWNRN